ncbi:hypothetical protein [Nonomuraea sp. NPDC005501]|uniref:hypothetical protein n=1 Tax=Nonomuraea sp. NPDC005501 TaxID=3156884 RepID=UPI00339EAD48
MGPALALVAGAAVVLLTTVIVGGLVLLGAEGLKPEAQVSAATLFDLLKIAFAVVAGLGGLVALVVTYRRQKVAKAAQKLAEATHVLARQGEERAHRAEAREATKLHNDRFATAAGQLGHDSPAVRLAGVHALVGLADDAPTRELPDGPAGDDGGAACESVGEGGRGANGASGAVGGGVLRCG